MDVAITRIKRYGDYKNFHDPEWISMPARVEVFAELAHVSRISGAIMGAAYTGLDNNGIVAVLRWKRCTVSGNIGRTGIQDRTVSPLREVSPMNACASHQGSTRCPDTERHRPEQKLPKMINPRREIGVD